MEASQNKMTEDKEKKTPGFKALNESSQHMILHATSVDGQTAPAEPTIAYKKMLEQTTTTHA